VAPFIPPHMNSVVKIIALLKYGNSYQ
jgi:hypothetical protein